MRTLLIILFLFIAVYGLYRFWNSKMLNNFKVSTYDEKSVDSIKENLQSAENKRITNLKTAVDLKATKEAEIIELEAINPSAKEDK
jgi:hypothetical protein